MTTSEQGRPPFAPPAREPAGADLDAWLDHALEDSFPASDPIAVHLLSQAERSAARRKDPGLI